VVIAVAGRRIDAVASQEKHFPLERVPEVRAQIRELLEARATAVVGAAACGADLLALTEAGDLGLRRRVVLPFERARFRSTSVTDRPGDWGALYDRVLDEVEAAGELVIIDSSDGDGDDERYAAANRIILDEAVSLAAALRRPAAALLIWDGKSRGPDDLTESFGLEARKRGLSMLEVKTI
jgi:hypothetical protein